jgi:hypothetical protein
MNEGDGGDNGENSTGDCGDCGTTTATDRELNGNGGDDGEYTGEDRGDTVNNKIRCREGEGGERGKRATRQQEVVVERVPGCVFADDVGGERDRLLSGDDTVNR